MRRKLLMKAASGAMALVMAASVAPMTVSAEEAGEWREENGVRYWYENGVKQGLEGRGKEIYDPGTDAWYWLDSIDGGKMATSKDVYQESEAGQWGDILGENGVRYGKWVRYDENGHMIKGWSTNEDGTYYFDPIFGTMAKGETTVDDIPCIFDMSTGIGLNLQWVEKDGAKYWYEGGKRQGYDPNNAAYRGKEIYDPASDAWYWLDNVDQGKMATSKDVYQESEAGQWADRADGTGKWVRYDENGHMIKGWSTNENGTYYFDPVYGTMAKGTANIDGVTYYFDENTGICQGEVDVKTYYSWRMDENTDYNASGDVESSRIYTRDNEGNTISSIYKSATYESASYYDSQGRQTESITVSNYSDTPNYSRTVYIYDGGSSYTKSVYYTGTNGTDWTVDRMIVYTRNAKGDVLTAKAYRGTEEEDASKLYYGYEYKYNDNNQQTEYIYYSYTNGEAAATSRTYYEYDGNGNRTRETSYYGTSDDKSYEYIYTYDGNGNETERVYNSYYNGEVSYATNDKYEYDANGNCVRETSYRNGQVTQWIDRTFSNIFGNDYYATISSFTYKPDGVVSSGYEYIYNNDGIQERYYVYGENKELVRYTVYDTTSFPKSEAGATCESTDYYYDGSGNPDGKSVYKYKCYAYTR